MMGVGGVCLVGCVVVCGVPYPNGNGRMSSVKDPWHYELIRIGFHWRYGYLGEMIRWLDGRMRRVERYYWRTAANMAVMIAKTDLMTTANPHIGVE